MQKTRVPQYLFAALLASMAVSVTFSNKFVEVGKKYTSHDDSPEASGSSANENDAGQKKGNGEGKKTSS